MQLTNKNIAYLVLLQRNVTRNKIKFVFKLHSNKNISKKITLLGKLKGKIYNVAHF